jgi:hypothetical protein
VWEKLIERTTVDYLTPLVNGENKKMWLLNYLIPQEALARQGLPKPRAVDIPQLVLNSFWAHRKDITGPAEIKAKNTENFLRFLFHRFPSDFANISV